MDRPNAEPPRTPAVMRVGVRLSLDRDAGELFADIRAFEAAGADSLWAEGSGAEPYVLLAACAAITWSVRLVAAGGTADAARATCERLARGRLHEAKELERSGERWLRSDMPKDRSAWKALRASASAQGVAGITLPNDPRLLDLLRNPDQDDDRSDLNIAVG